MTRGSGVRRQRADAQQNRSHLLKVARVLFVKRGLEVTMSDLARAAKVGVGTVYRHFPTQQALVTAAAQQRFDEILALVQASAERASFEQLLWDIGEALEQDRGLTAVMTATYGSSEPWGKSRKEILAAASTALSTSQAAGAIRSDVTVQDIYSVVGALSFLIRDKRLDWRRFLSLVLDGLRGRSG
jgi:AcrR family transcriptional regulator